MSGTNRRCGEIMVSSTGRMLSWHAPQVDNVSMHRLYPLFRPLLFAADPERAHQLAFRGLDVAVKTGLARLAAPTLPVAPVVAMGIRFPNAVGLAAGLDKNAEHLAGLATLGFGFLEA